jgi:uncharacterized cupredoxin-like copper-binding protein
VRSPLTLAVAIVAAFAIAGCGGSSGGASKRTIEVHFSHFAPSDLSVRAGEPVTFVLRNTDPIAHEWIVGTAGVHERHRTGTEPYHDQVPTEVTIPPLSERETTVTFDKPGQYLFICHLPGHEAYGMVGTITVT